MGKETQLNVGSDSILVVPQRQIINKTFSIRLSLVRVFLKQTYLDYINPGPVFINPTDSTITITLPNQEQKPSFATFRHDKSPVRLIFNIVN